jgi:HAD superfamily hydrolase (TIGR01509 family)
VRAVLFDADGVVQDERPFADELAAMQGWTVDDAWAFVHEMWDSDAQADCLIGARDLIVTIAEMLAARSVTTDVTVFYREWLARTIVPSAEVLDAVDALRASGVVCALATNQEAFRFGYMAEELGYRGRFDHLFASCEMGTRKPDESYFVAILEALALPASDVLFLDDHPGNVDAARAVGIHADLVEQCADVPALLRTRGLLA